MDIRDLTPDDLGAVLEVRKRSFGPISASDTETWYQLVTPSVEQQRYLGVFDGDRLMAAARYRRLTQWWHGRPQPLAGVAGVVVGPEDRGRGVGRTITRAVMRRAVEHGYALSALYPATTAIYRSVGYEHVGAQHIVTLPTEALRSLAPAGTVKLRRMGPGDAPEVIATLGRIHAATRASGPISWEERTWRQWLGEEDDFLYLADDGFAVYRWDDGAIELDTLVAVSEETTRALWSLVGSASTVAKSVTACVAPDDPILWLLRERTKEQVKQVRWMLRVHDLPLAMERRGFSAAVELDAVVRVEDAEEPGAGGTWRLTVSGGAGRAEPAQGEGPRLSANGLAALYGGLPAGLLRRTGMLRGDDRYDEALESAFAASPYMLDYF
ncbi:GNAT family N-acetyltransferase [Nonomuraea sp. NPDC050310]|uniref:GNAT family N-acetyltransferase n=1 Tax=Nonomuraea sp. NPDC050310 TaxID=3154935 RepID=UPI0033FE19D6